MKLAELTERVSSVFYFSVPETESHHQRYLYEGRTRPFDEVNIIPESGRYTIYVDFHLFPWFDSGTALCEIAVLKRYD